MDIEEGIIYYFFSFIKNCEDNIAKKIIDNYKNKKDISIFSDKFKDKYKDLLLFIKYFENFKKKESEGCYILLEQFYSEGNYNIYYLFMLILAFNMGLKIEEFLNIDDELIKKILLSYKLYNQKKFTSSYKIIVSISYIQKYKMIIDLILLQNLIELNMLDEALTLAKEFYLKNKTNVLFNLIIGSIYLKKGDMIEALKYYNKFKRKLKNQKLRENYFFILLKTGKPGLWVKVISKIKILDDHDYYYIAKYYHKMGYLDFAYEYYKKVDPVKFPVHKMIGIIFYQMGKIKDTVFHLKKEIELRGEQPDVVRILKYLQLKILLKK